MALNFIPGYYAKVRIDDEGKIVDVGDLEVTDLPKHKHSLEDLLDESVLEQKISDILANFFVNNGSTSVEFTYDKGTRTITADVNIDEESIVRNEYGQLTSTGATIVGGDQVSSQETELLSRQLEELKASLPDLFKEILSQTFVSTENTAVDFVWDKNTGTFSADVNIDGISIEKDEFGNLKAVAADPSGAGTNCATHTHTSDQIEDFEEAVVNIFNDYSKNISIDFEKYIDGTTIKINEYGQLTAVRTVTEKHQHYLADIVDYEAAEAAAKQMLTTLGDDVDYSDGVLNLTDLNIGYSILAINKYLKDVVGRSIQTLTKKIEKISIARDNNGLSILSIHSSAIHNNLYDKFEKATRTVYLSNTVYLTLDYVPYTTGKIILYKDEVPVANTEISSLGIAGSSSGIFSVESVNIKNTFSAKVLKIDVRALLTSEGVDIFQIAFDTEDGEDFTNKVTIYSTPFEHLSYSVKDLTATHEKTGTIYYTYPVVYKYEISINNYNSYRFVNLNNGFVSGKVTGIAEGNKTLQIPDLFTTVPVDLTFKYTVEHSTSDLQNILTVSQGDVVNDRLTKDPDSDYTATFDIPNSTMYNSLEITCTDPNFDISKTKLVKGNRFVPGTREASDKQTGYIKLSDHSYILTFGNSYDNGLEEMQFKIQDTKNLNLNKLHFNPVNF